MAIDVGITPRSFLAWWAAELATMLPPVMREQVFGGGPGLNVSLDGSGIVLELIGDEGLRRRERIDAGRLPTDRAGRRAIASMLAEADEVILRLPERQALRATFDLPLAAGDALRPKLAAEIKRRTPFRERDVLWDWRVTRSDMDLQRLYVDVLIARRSDAEKALALARAAGISADRLAAAGGGDGDLGFNLLREDEPGRRRRRSWWLRPLVLSVLVLAVAWGALALERRKTELEALEARFDSLRVENSAVSEMEARYEELAAMRAFLADRKRTARPVLEILADVTVRLPDGDWVHFYAVDGGRLTIEGFSREAARLPDLLEVSDQLGEVAFAAPVRRDAQSDGEYFSVSASLEPVP